MQSRFTVYVLLLASILQKAEAIASPVQPFRNYPNYYEIEPGKADLWWSIDDIREEITFEFHIKTLGWIALGISPGGGMKGADIGLGWVDQLGYLHFEDRMATGYFEPMRDMTSIDWFGMRGREQDGWTAIQFKRRWDTCDSSDVAIKSGTNMLICAYGTEDPMMVNGRTTITYHEMRRGSRIIPLRSFTNPPSEHAFNGLDYIDFKIDKYSVPTTDTTYYCEIFRVPKDMTERRHAIAYETLIDPNNYDLVHHVLVYECDSTSIFDDNNLPKGLCDDVENMTKTCSMNIATGWAVGGNKIVEFPEEAGYPLGGDFEIKYYMFQMHYDNPNRMAGRQDSSGIRYYLGAEPRKYELGYIVFGTQSSVLGISLPPKADQFIIDSYCPAMGTSKIPSTGITLFAALPHTHLQGHKVWSKLIRNKTAVEYLFNAESFNFNYQFQHMLPEPIQLFPGDEVATQCTYSTANKDTVTIGGEGTRDEMCLNFFGYYPRMNNMHLCATMIPLDVWKLVMNTTTEITETDVENFVKGIQWNSALIYHWQTLFTEAPKVYAYGNTLGYGYGVIDKRPEYQDLMPEICDP